MFSGRYSIVEVTMENPFGLSFDSNRKGNLISGFFGGEPKLKDCINATKNKNSETKNRVGHQ